MKTIKFYAMAVMAIAMLASCSNDDDNTPAPVEEEEAITELILTFTNQNDPNDTVTLTWDDENLDEVKDPSEKTVQGTFTEGATYDAELELFNQDEDFLEEDILADQAGVDAHFFVYATTLDFDMMRTDGQSATRSDNNKLGVNTSWTANAAGSGTITIELFHESPNVSDNEGFGSAEGDDTDIEISFDVEIQ